MPCIYAVPGRAFNRRCRAIPFKRKLRMLRARRAFALSICNTSKAAFIDVSGRAVPDARCRVVHLIGDVARFDLKRRLRMLRHVVHSRCRCNTSKAALIDASRSASCIRSIEKRDMQYRHYECTTRHRCRAMGSAPGPTWAQSLSMPGNREGDTSPVLGMHDPAPARHLTSSTTSITGTTTGRRAGSRAAKQPLFDSPAP